MGVTYMLLRPKSPKSLTSDPSSGGVVERWVRRKMASTESLEKGAGSDENEIHGVVSCVHESGAALVRADVWWNHGRSNRHLGSGHRRCHDHADQSANQLYAHRHQQ